jgi:uncharacterized protein YwgA
MKAGITKGPAIISYLIKNLHKSDPQKQIGKTVVQKLIFLTTRNHVGDYEYALYHYGPYSGGVSSDLQYTTQLGALEINWNPDKGYFITPKSTESLEKELSPEEKTQINEIIEKYGKFNAIELSLIATAMFIIDKGNFHGPKENLVKIVKLLKPQHSEAYILHILNDCKEIPDIIP